MAKTKKTKFISLIKNKKILIIVSIALILIVALVLMAIGVGQKRGIKSQIKTMFKDIKSANFSKIANYIDHDVVDNYITDDESVNKQFEILFSKLNYKIESIKISGNKATVKIEVKNRDIESVLKQYEFKAVSEITNKGRLDDTTEDEDNSGLNFMKNKYEEADELVTKLEIVLNKENGKWQIKKENQNGKSIINAILPRYLKYRNQN